MLRVNKDNLCPICLKPDWCLVSEDGRAAICARVKEGSTCSAGEAGYLHILDEKYVAKPYVPPEYPPIDWSTLAYSYCDNQTKALEEKLEKEWCVSEHTLSFLSIGWDGEAYTIPMRNGNFEIIGIRRRFPNGEKCAVSGSKNGLFYHPPTWEDIPPELIIVEGASDCATLLDMGFYAIGRANCNSGTEYIKEFIKNNPNVKGVLILPDNDRVGLEGAEKLKDCIKDCVDKVSIIYPPLEETWKDVREQRQKDPKFKERIKKWLEYI